MPSRVHLAHTHVSAGDVSDSDRRKLEQFVIEAGADSSITLLLQRMLSSLSRGADIDMFSNDAELSPQQAAEILKMSRPHLLKFMDRGDLPFRRVGTHRRIAMGDLMEFAAAREAGSKVVAEALGSQADTVSEISPLTCDQLDELNSL